jgi:Ca2+-binding EF-hand superfamily protein
MQISTGYGNGGFSAMRGAMGSQNMDEMDSRIAKDIFGAKDADKSGSLSASELGISSDQLKTSDSDGDGNVSQTELTATLKSKREKMQSQMQNQMAQSGQMGMLQASMGQGSQGMQGMDMSKMDSKMSRNIISEKDTNKDGVLSASELGVSADNLKSIDADGSGSVDESELTASLKSKREEMMSKGGGPMGPPPGGAENASGGQGSSQIDSLISSLFGDEDDESSTSSSTSAASADSSSLTRSLSEYMQRQKASSSYLNMDRLINDLFSSGSDTQSLAVSA